MPVFRRRALEERTPQTPVPGLTPTRTAFTETPAPETVTRSRLALLAAMLCIATLAAACALLWGQNRTLRRSAGVTNATPAVRAFWQPFLSHRERTDVVLPDTSISLIQDITNRQIPLSEYLSRKYPDETEAPGLSGDRRMDLETIGRRHLSGFGDFQVAQRMLSLPFNNGSMFLQFAREYTPESVKYNNVILIGGRRSNPWVELFATRMNFSIEYDARLKKTAIRNRFPRKGEQTLYGLSPDPFQSDGYCVVAFLPNPSHSADAVIFAGTNAEATNAAGEFLSTEKPLAGFRKLLSADKFPYFEVLLRTTRLSGTALSAELLTYRSYPE
jgi:hypothetical protein